MKKSVFILASLLILSCSIFGNPAPSDTLQVLCTPGISSLAKNWADGYSSTTNVPIKVTVLESNAIAERREKGVVAFVSGDEISNIAAEGSLRIVVGREIVVPVINSENPFGDEIASKGVSAEKLAEAFRNPENANWGFFLGNAAGNKANLMYMNDKVVESGIALMTGKDAPAMHGTMNAGDILSMLNKDKYAIGFVKLTDICNAEGSIMSDLKLLPIDRNNNGVLDYNENIYGDMTSFTRGIWIGKYPKELCSNIYSVSYELQDDQDATAFLNWILVDGQDIITASGMTALISSEKMSAAERLNAMKASENQIAGQKSIFGGMLLTLIGLIVVYFLIDYLFVALRKKPKVVVNLATGSAAGNLTFDLPGGMYFDKTHTWAFMEPTGSVKVGIDDFMLHITGNLSRINMKKTGEKVKKGEEIMSLVQNGKKLTLYSPVSGTISDKNSELENDASLIYKSPYSDGWVYRIDPENWQRENQLLFMAEKHKQFITGEIARIKDMIAAVINGGQPQYATVLQDGGMLQNGVLSEFGPEVWEEFQQKIIDPSRQVWFYEIF